MKMFPGAIARPISRNYTPRRRAVTRGVILHIAASESDSLHGWFNNPAAKASSHLYYRRDGTPEQYVDIDQIAWTSGKGSSETIGVESQGMGNGPWTAAQCEGIAQFIAWSHKEYGYPLKLMRSSRKSESGVGWHAQGVPATRSDKNRGISQTGGQLWSSSVGKTCPGAACIAQIPGIVARARVIAGLDKTKSTPKPKPVTQSLAQAGVEIGDPMKNVGIYYEKGKNVVYAILNPASGFFHKYSAGTNRGPIGGQYNNPIAKAFDTGSYVKVTESHFNVIERACADVRKGA